jgi:hypothetical protein
MEEVLNNVSSAAKSVCWQWHAHAEVMDRQAYGGEYTKGYAGVAPGTLRCGIDDRGNRVVVLTSTRSSAASDAQGRISCNQYLHLAYLHLWSVCAHPDSCGSRLSGMYNLTRWRWG